MQKASIGKILLALVISCVYIYLFGIVQVVHVSADNEREIEVSIPEATTSAETEKTPETTTIKLQDDKKPTLADVKAQTTATTKAETTTSTTTVKKRTPAPAAADNTVVIPETTTVTTTTTAATTVEPETTTAETTSAPTPTPDNSGEEQLSVYDQVTGTYYTAGAREIIARAVVVEIWNEFPDEAVKAQAVAEYTYIKKNNEMGVSPTTALKTDVYDRIYKLVDEVLGEAIYYNGEMIQCSVFASS